MSMHLVDKVGSVSIQNVSRILAGYPMNGNINLIQIMSRIL